MLRPLTRRRFLKDSVLAALVLPVGRWFAAEHRPVTDPVAYGLEILPRGEWAGDDPPTGSLEGEDVRFLLVHHTASGNEYQPEDVPGLLRSFFRFHTGPEKGWADIAYNFLIDRYGRVWEGREGSLEGPVAGSATGGNQGYSQLVALIGDFTDTMPTKEALEALRRTLAWLADRYTIDTSPGATTSFISRGSNRWSEGSQVETGTIAGHRDMSLTQCPGDTLYAYVVEDLSADVTGFRAPATTTTSSVATTTSSSTTTPTSSTPTSTSGTGASKTPPSTSHTPLSTDEFEAVSAPGGSAESTRDIPSGGLQVVGLAAVAVLVGLLAVIRRRISNAEAKPLEQESGSRSADLSTPEGYRSCVDCGEQNSVANRYCDSCGGHQESQQEWPS